MRLAIAVCLIGASAGVMGCQPNSATRQVITSAIQTKADGSDPTRLTNESVSNIVQFVEVAEAAGIDWIPRNGEESGYYAILESLGTGCAVADYDQDGQLDIFLTGGGTFGQGRDILPLPMALYRQTNTWRFSSVEANAGLQPIRHYSHGTCTADFDEDGFPDLLITGFGGLQLFHNCGDGTFVDVTELSGLTDHGWSSAAAWADLNRDGLLDLFIGHYVNWSFDNHPACVDAASGARIVCAPSAFQGLPCLVYLATGDGTFREASHELGINQIGKTLGVVIGDLDASGQVDIYVGNDTTPNHLYRRQLTGEFRELGLVNGVALGEKGEADGSMGVDIGDVDGDGKLDIWVANFENQSFAFYRNLGNELFSHSSRAYGVTAVGTAAVGFGTVIFDVDGDGFQDVFCSNGHIHAPNFPVERRQEPFLFLNDRGKRLKNIAPTAGEYLRKKHLGRGVACGDFDGNGTPDLVVSHLQERIALLRNDTPIENWLSVRLIGRTSPRSAIGSRVTLKTGGRQQVKLIRGGGSYLSTSDLSLLFGLGHSQSIDSLEVLWPSGQIQHFTEIKPGKQLTIVEAIDPKP